MNKIIFSNVAEGTHICNITKKAKAAILTKYLLVKLDGSDEVTIAGASDVSVGVITDEAAQGDDVNVALLGCAETLKMVSNGAITVGSIVVADANGKVKTFQSIPAGTYYQVGIALTSVTAAGKIVEVLSCVPQKLVVTA